MLDSLLRGDLSTAPMPVGVVLISLLLAFLAGQLIAWIYMSTHDGVSYSRSFVVSLVILPIIVALVMMVLSNNFVTAFGLMAVFAIVRFRNILRDTLDTCYILGAIVVGMACGTQKFTTAVVGGILVAAVMVYVWLTAFGSRHRHDFLLNVQWTRPRSEIGELHRLLERHSRRTACVLERATGEAGYELGFQLLLRDPDKYDLLLREVHNLAGVRQLSGIPAADHSEV
jgi:hypothetical protein